MKKFLFTLLLLSASLAGWAESDTYFSLGAAFPFTWHRIENMKDDAYGRGGDVDFQIRNVDEKGEAVFIELYLGGLASSTLKGESESSWPFIDVSILFGYGYDFINSKNLHLMLCFTGGFDNLYHYSSESHYSYDLELRNNVLNFVLGFDLSAEFKLDKEMGLFAGITGLAGIGMQELKYEKEYRSGSGYNRNYEDKNSSLFLSFMPKAGFSYRF